MGVALLSVTLVFLGLVRFLGYFEYLHFRKRQKSRLRDPLTERLRLVVPRLIVARSEAKREADVLDALERLTSETEIQCMEMVSAGSPVHCWKKPGADCSKRDLVELEFPIGRDDLAVATLKLGWSSDQEDPAPQVDVLLQILVDEFARTLAAVESAYAPAPRRSDPMASPAPIPVPSYAKIQ